MLDPSFALDISSWAAPTIAILIGGAVTGVASAIIGRQKDRRKAEIAEVAEAKRLHEELDSSLVTQVREMHTALLGEKPTAFNPNPSPGLFAKVERIENTLFSNGGRHNTVLDRLGRIENSLPKGEDNP